MKKQELELKIWKAVVKKSEERGLDIPDIYEGLDNFIEKNNIHLLPLKCAGAAWDHIYEHIINKIQPNIIIEVGSYVGYSSCKMAEYNKKHKKDFSIICIDPWLWCGWNENFDARINGYPVLYYSFLKNVKSQNHDDVIIPYPMPALTAYLNLKKVDILADVIYIDGAHDYENVYLDITRYYNLLREGGVIYGDDWAWESVREGVNGACDELRIHSKLQIVDGCWVIQK